MTNNQALCRCPGGELEICQLGSALSHNQRNTASPELCKIIVCIGDASKCEREKTRLERELRTTPDGTTELSASESEAVTQYCLDNGVTDFAAGKQAYFREQA